MTTWTSVAKSAVGTAEVDFLFSDGLDYLFSDATDYVFSEASVAGTWGSPSKNTASWTSPNQS